MEKNRKKYVETTTKDMINLINGNILNNKFFMLQQESVEDTLNVEKTSLSSNKNSQQDNILLFDLTIEKIN